MKRVATLAFTSVLVLVASGLALAQALPDSTGGQPTLHDQNRARHGQARGVHMSRDEVMQLQTALQREGLYQDGTVDGGMGPKTRRALREYQKRHDLPATGRPDSATLAKLGAAKSDTAGTSSTPPGTQPPATTPPDTSGGHRPR